jgi:proline iminopeptidase
MLVLHTPGLQPGYLRGAVEALDDRPLYVDYRPDGDVDSWLAQIEALRAQLSVPSFHVFGHGLGGRVAQAYAAAHPASVKRLILCSTAPSLTWLGSRLGRSRAALAQLNDEQFRQLCLDILPLAFANPTLGVEKSVHELFAQEPFCRRAFVSALGCSAELPPIKNKTLILHGRYDRLIWLDEGRQKLLDHLDDAELVVFERSGHFPFLEQPGPFFMAVNPFLKDPSEKLSVTLA